MKKELSVWLMLSVAVLLGSLSATTLGGCQANEDEDVEVGADYDGAEESSDDTPEKPRVGEARAMLRWDPDTDLDPEEEMDEESAPDGEEAGEGDGDVAPEGSQSDEPGDEAGEGGDEPDASEGTSPEDEGAESKDAGTEAAAPKDDSSDSTGAAENSGSEQADPATLVSTDVEESVDPSQVLKAGGDWPQWGGTRLRNNVPGTSNMPEGWNIGKFDRRSGEWDDSRAENIKWFANLGSQTYGNPVVANGQVYVGTNNGAGHLARYPNDIDLGCLLCFDETNGQLLWQHSSEKLITGRVHDWPLQGICCAPLVEGDRLWFVTSRGEVRCLDTDGFHDGTDDGEVTGEMGTVLTWTVPSKPNTEDEETLAAFEKDMSDFQGMKQGLSAGTVSDALKALLAERGFAIDGDATVTTETEGSKWKVVAMVGGAERVMHVTAAGPKVVFSKIITADDKQEADTLWVFNMMKELGVSQHNMCSCSVTSYGDLLFVNTSNGLDESHINLPAPDAPSFICMNKNTGEVLWTNGGPGTNILHGQWSSPTVAELGGVPQALFAGGDGWLYSFRADGGKDGKPELLWKFDCNPKESKWILGGAGTRNNIIATPVVYDDLVYLAVGQDPEHGEGEGHLWCIDPTKRGDVSPQLAVKLVDGERVPIEHKRIQAVEPEKGEAAIDNPNSAVVWHYTKFDQNGDDIIDFEEEMHRSCGTCTIKDDVLYIADFSGIVHCLDAKGTKDGQPIVHFTYDMLAQSWGSALIADGKVYIGDEDGDVCIFEFGAENNEPIDEINMGSSVYSSPVAANNTLYVSTKDKLFAISQE